MLWWKWLAPDKTPDKSPSQSCSSATEEKRGNSSWHHHKKESRAQETVWQMTLKMNKTHKKGNTSGPPPVTIYSRNIGTEVIMDGSHVIGAISVSTMSVVIIIIIIRNSYIAPNPTWLAQSTSQFNLCWQVCCLSTLSTQSMSRFGLAVKPVLNWANVCSRT